jgi:titin
LLAPGNGSDLTVTWIDPAVDDTHSAATDFNLRSSPPGADIWTLVAGVTSPYDLSSLLAGSAIDVQIQGSNAAGTSAWSVTSTFTTANAAPNAPGAATLAQGNGSDLSVIWTFPAVDSTHNAATAFNLRSGAAGTGAWTTVANATSPYTLSGLAAGAAFDVQIQSSNIAGTSAWSATSTLITATAAPNTPGPVSLAQGAGGTLIATWAAPAVDTTHNGATGFNLRSSPSGAGTWTTMSGVSSPYTISGLTAGAAFDVQIQATNTAGPSAWSATATLATAAAVPNAPSAPSAPSLAVGTGSNLTVTWTAPTVDSMHNAATGFNLRSSPSGAGTWTTVAGVTSPFTLSGLADTTAIDVQVQASDEAGNGAWSATSTLTTASAGPYAPNAPSIASIAPPPNGTNSQLTVTWTGSAVDGTHGAATGYNLRYSPAGAGTWTTVSGITSPYTLTGLGGAVAIDVAVQGTNAAPGPGAWSSTTTSTTWGTTVAPAAWTAAASQVHNTSVAPNGGVQMTVVAAPTAITGAAFAWSAGNSSVPTTGLIAAGTDGQTNGWGQYFNAPAAAGTYYLWMLAQGAGSSTIGALVTSAITVS